MLKKFFSLMLLISVLLTTVSCSTKTPNNLNNTTKENTTTETTVTTTIETADDKQKAREEYAKQMLDSFLSKNYNDYKINELKDLKVIHEINNEAIAYNATFNVNIDNKECLFTANLVKNANPSYTTDLYYDKILEEFKTLFNDNKYIKEAKEKIYEIKSPNGEKMLPVEIQSLDTLLFASYRLSGYDLYATFIFEDKKDFCPENLELEKLLDSYGNYTLHLYNTKDGKLKEQYNHDAKTFDENILDMIKCNIKIVEQNIHNAYDNSVIVEKDDDGKYEKQTTIEYVHNKYQKIGDLTFCYDDRFHDLKIEEVSAIEVPDIWKNSPFYIYTPQKNSYKTTFKEKDVKGVTKDNGLNYKYTIYTYMAGNKKLAVTEYATTVTAIYPVAEYKGLIPYTTTANTLLEISDTNYLRIDFSTCIKSDNFVLAFFKKQDKPKPEG